MKQKILLTIISLAFVVMTKAQSDVTNDGVVINGVKWATRNVDAPGTFAVNPEDAGMFYQWNSKTGWRYNDPLTSSDGTSTWNGRWNGNGATAWERANDPCPSGWRMPNQGELNGLISSGGFWTVVNSMNGRKFGSGSNTIFLPAVGYRNSNNGKLYDVGSVGSYWVSTQGDSSGAYFLYFDSGNVRLNYYYKAIGFPCRCVADEPTNIDVPLAEPVESVIVGYYSILGEKLPKIPERGLYIILYSDGKVVKMVK